MDRARAALRGQIQVRGHGCCAGHADAVLPSTVTVAGISSVGQYFSPVTTMQTTLDDSPVVSCNAFVEYSSH